MSRALTGFAARATLAVVVLAASAAFATAQVSPAPEDRASAPQMSPAPKRFWPSQQRPSAPIEVRICSCLYAGESTPIGETICMKFEGRNVRATCEAIINNPSWKITSEPCPST